MSRSKNKKSTVPSTRAKSVSSTSNLVKTEFYQSSGPLPAPEQLEKYNQIIPGAGEHIVKMAEDGFNHVHEIVKRNCKSYQ